MRLISSFCALACVSALPLAAVAQTAAEPPAPETAPDTAGRTVLDVTASGTLTGLAADALGPDAALTVRLHGPVAFDVDTADFASLEIFADDPAVKLTVSDTAAYDRITAVSLPAAASGEPAAATFSAAAASAGIATLAEGDTATAVTPQNRVISINFEYGRDTNTHPVVSGDSVGLVPVPSAAWFNAVQNKDSLSTGREETVNTYWNGTEKDTSLTGVTLWCKAATCWEYTDGVTDAFLKGYLDDGQTDEGYGAQINLSTIPFEMYDVYVYCATDTASQKFRPITIEYEDGSSIVYTANGAHPYGKAVAGNSDFGMTQQKTAILNTNTLLLRGLTEKTLKVRGGVGSGSTPRGGIAAIQVVESRSVSVKGEQTLSGTLAGSSSTTHAMFLLEADSALKVDSKNFNRLWIIGPETGTATLQIAADVDFSKIDLSEARNVTIELVSGCTTIPGGEWAVGDVKISTPVTLTVDGADVTPYWSVGGSLTIAEGSSLTVAVAEGVTITKPIQVISAGGTISGTISATAGLKVTKVGNVCWLTGSGTIRPKDELSGSVTWSSIKDSLVDNSGDPANLTEASSLVLTFAAGASEGTTLTIDETLTLGSLAVNNQSANPVSIELGTGGSLTVANQVTVAAGGVSLPIGTLFDMTTVGETSAPSAPADKPAFVVAAGATATLTGGVSGTSYIRKEPISGGGTVVKSEGISRLDLCGVPGAVPNLEDVTLCIEGGGLKLTTGDVAGNNNAVLKSATVVFAGTNPALYMYGWARLGGEVSFVSESNTTSALNNSYATSFLSLDNAEATLVLKRGENATEGVALPRVVLASGVAARVESGHATINLNGTSGSINVNGGKLTLEDPLDNVPVTVASGATVSVPADAGTLALGGIRGKGVIEIVPGTQAEVNGFGMSDGVFKGTLRIAEGVTKTQDFGSWTIPCNVELNGTVSGTLTVPNGKRFGGSGTVTGQLKLENGYILKCGEAAADVPLIGTKVEEGKRVFDTSVPATGGRLWRDTAKEDFILRLAKIDDYDPAFIADSSGYVVDKFTEGAVSGLRLAAAFELDLSDLRDPGKTSGTYAWNVAKNWLPPAGKSGFPGDANNKDAVVRIMVPASRNVTVVIPPGTSAAVRAIQVIGMTGEADGWTSGTLRWVEGDMPSGSDDVPSPTELTSTLTARELRMAGPMEITQECNVSVQYEAYWSEGAHIGSDAAHCSVWIKAGAFKTNLLLVANTDLRVGGGSLKASVSCDSLNLQTQSGGTGLLKIDQNGDFTPSYIHGISEQDSLELAGGTFTVPAGGMELSDQIEVSADSTLHFAGTELAKAILSFVDGAPRTGFSGSGTLTLTGTGTLDASNATGDGAYTGHLQFPKGNQVVCNIGQRRPAIGGAPYRIEVVRKTEEADEVRIPLNDVDTFVMPPLSDANATAGVAVVRVEEKTESDGNTTISIVPDWVGTVAKIDRSKTPADLVLTPLGYPMLDNGNAPGISGEAAMVLRELANSGNSNFTVRQTTVTGDTMDFDAEGVNAALLLFTNVAKAEDDGSVTVAYAFGISDITVEGDDIIVTAKVLGPEGAADFAEAASVDLYRDGVQSTAVPSAGTEVGTRVLKLEGALSTLEADAAATFTIKATSGVEQTPDESVPDEGTE